MDDTTGATRAMYQTIQRQLLVLLGVLLVLGLGAGYLIAGLGGVWGALMAVAIAGFFMLTTVAIMLATADKPLAIASAAFVAGWLVKVLVLFGILIAVRGRDFYHPAVFFAVLTVAIIGSTIIEMRAVATARVPNTGTGSTEIGAGQR
ncbi:MAG: hypothetical protein EOM10_17975 [Opitutae bacterium]|nr:hypothetical protein [Opitutae bacterium]